MKIKNSITGILLVVSILLCSLSAVHAEDSSAQVQVSEEQDAPDIEITRRFPNFNYAIGIRTGYAIPVGLFSDQVKSAFAGSLFLSYNPDRWMRNLFGDLFEGLVFELEFSYFPQKLISDPSLNMYLHTLVFSGGLKYIIPLSSILNMDFYMFAGYNYNKFQADQLGKSASVNSGSFKFGADLLFDLAYHSDLGIGLAYRVPYDSSTMMGFMFYASYSFRIGAEPKENLLQIPSASIIPIFPSRKNKYASMQGNSQGAGESNIGSVTLLNTGEEAVTNILVKTIIPGYNQPTATPGSFQLNPGESESIYLYSYFDESILHLTTTATTTAEVVVQYIIEGDPRTYTKRVNVPVVIYEGNALVWEPRNHVCAFVSGDDPSISRLRSSIEHAFSRSSSNFDHTNEQYLEENLMNAMRAFSVLKSMNLEYQSDPDKPFDPNSQTMDTVQYPSEFLDEDNRTGDCDDFSVVYASILQSLNVPVAFIVIPGHIFLMFNTGIDEDQIGRITEDPDKVIVMDDNSVWIPIEATFIDNSRGDFINSWTNAIREYRDNIESAGFIPVEQGWQEFPSVSINYDADNMQTPDYDRSRQEYVVAINAYLREHRHRLYATTTQAMSSLSVEERVNAAKEIIDSSNPSRAIPVLLSILSDGESDFMVHYYLATAYIMNANQMHSFNQLTQERLDYKMQELLNNRDLNQESQLLARIGESDAAGDIRQIISISQGTPDYSQIRDILLRRDAQEAIDNFLISISYLTDSNDIARYLSRIYINVAIAYDILGPRYSERRIRFFNLATETNPGLARRFQYLGE